MAYLAKVSLATDLPVYSADPHSPWQRPSNENANRLYREYLPKGTVIPDHQPYLTTIAEEISNRPRRQLGFLTPTESFAGCWPANPMLLPRFDTTVTPPSITASEQRGIELPLSRELFRSPAA